jgi:transcription antitermination factor NusG
MGSQMPRFGRKQRDAPSAVVIDKGAHVRALAGPFAGQTGVVQELDGKGAARVLFGLLTTRVPLRDLKLHDRKRGRPVMSSSHRKPNT